MNTATLHCYSTRWLIYNHAYQSSAFEEQKKAIQSIYLFRNNNYTKQAAWAQSTMLDTFRVVTRIYNCRRASSRADDVLLNKRPWGYRGSTSSPRG